MSSGYKISVWAAILMNINIMIGVGIFIGPQLMAQKAGYASFLGWPLVALLFLPVALGFAIMARLFPGANGIHSYSKNAINETTGFMSGWFYYLGYTSTAALQTLCLRDVVLQYVALPPLLFNLFLVTVITLLSLLNIKIVGRIQSAGTIFKILPLLFVLAVFIGYWNPSFSISVPNLLNVPATVPMAVFGFLGFEACCTISHLIGGHPNNASRAIIAGFLITTAIYTLFHFGLLHIMGLDNLSANRADTFVAFLGINSQNVKAMLSLFVSLSIIIAFLNAIFGIFTATTSTLHALAREKFLPLSNKLASESKQQRPWVCILTQGVVVFAILCATSSKSILISVSNLGIISTYTITLIALYAMQKRTGLFKQMFMTFFAFASCFFFVYLSWIGVGDTSMARFLATLPLIAAAVIGFVMYSYQRKANQ